MLAVQVLWCVACQRALAWSLMASAESPATLFELLYLFFPRTGLRVMYDNGCNFESYALNRDPLWMASLRALIDDLHWAGHTDCAASFHAGAHLDMMTCCDHVMVGQVAAAPAARIIGRQACMQMQTLARSCACVCGLGDALRVCNFCSRVCLKKGLQLHPR